MARQYDEHVSGNPLHALVFVLAACIAIRRRSRHAVIFAACVTAGALLFALLLKWQPWHSRMHLPLFIVASGLSGAMLERKFSARATALIACMLVVAAVPPLFRDMLRPVIARRPVFTKSYDENMFADVPSAYPDYAAATGMLAARGCTRIGLLNSKGAYEFPIWKMLRDRARGPVEIRHVQVSNPSRLAMGKPDEAFVPCALVLTFRLGPEAFNPVPAGFIGKWSSQHVTVFLPDGAPELTRHRLR